MNKINWVDGRYTTPDDFNAMQTEPEAHIQSLGQRLPAGVVDGCVPTGAGTVVTIGAGVAWDAAGRRIVIPVGGAAVDMTGIDRPALGRYRWLTWAAAYRRLERGSVLDKAGAAQAAYFDDSFVLSVAAGAEFEAASIAAARDAQLPTRPSAPAGSVSLGYSILDHATPYSGLFTDATLYRTQAPRPIAPLFIHNVTGAAALKALDALGAIIPRQRDYAFGAGGVKTGSGRVYPMYPAAWRNTRGQVIVEYVTTVSTQPYFSNMTLHAVFDRVASYGQSRPPR